MAIIDRFYELYHQRVLELTRSNAAIKLSREEDSRVAVIGEALVDTMKNRVSPEEKKYIRRIEALRKVLNETNEMLEIVDYGAGSKNKLVDAENTQGTVVYRNLGELSRRASKPYFWSLFLFKVIRKMVPLRCLEMGTCLGVSAMYQASAVILNEKGDFTTIEGAPELVRKSKEHFHIAQIDNINIITGRFADVLPQLWGAGNTYDYIFVDGHHTEEATLRYFSDLLRHIDQPALLIFDDISYSKGMKAAWDFIRFHDRVSAAIDLRVIGLCFIENTPSGNRQYKVPLI